MKIAHVVDSMEVGGAETIVSQMCHLQREQGHDPCVYAVGPLGALGERMRQDGFVVQPDVGRHLRDSTRAFFRIFKSSRPDVAHFHNPTPTIYGATAARIAGIPSILSTRHSLVAPPHNWVMELKYALAAFSCDWIVGICDATTNNIRKLHSVAASKIVRIYNGALPLARVAREHLPPKTGFTLVYVGRIEPVKNHVLLLHAFRTALSSNVDLRLWIVGNGSERKTLENLVAKLNIVREVTFWGQQNDVAPFFSAADAFIMSSKSEGLPMSLLQAFSLGLPAIVTDVGGMAEVVRVARAGLIVPLTNVEDMARAILQLTNHPAERKQLSIDAEETFHSQFTLTKMVDAYMDLYQSHSRL